LGEIGKNKAYKNLCISDRHDLINEVIESNNFRKKKTRNIVAIKLLTKMHIEICE